MWKIPVSSVDVAGLEEEYVVDAIRSTWVSSTGKYVDRFEQEFSEICNTKMTVACANGTTAMHLALLGLKLEPGDEVIVPSMTFIASANAIRYCGAEPVFVDVDPNTWCLDPRAVEAAVTPRTKGIMAVHLMGHPADMDALNRLAAIYGLWVLEDAAEAHFAKYKGRMVGSLGTMGTFSFYGNKIITSGEGGAITLNDPRMESHLKTLRGHGMDPRRRYFFPVTGYNYRLTNVSCAMLCAQLRRRDEIVAQRRKVFAHYQESLRTIPGIRMQPVAPWAEPAPWMFSCLVDPNSYGLSRDELMQGLAAEGIDSRPFFHPLHQLPPYRECAARQKHDLTYTEQLGMNGIMLPTYNTLSVREIESIAATIVRLRARQMRFVA